MDWIFAAVASGHVGLLGVWFGSMLYSLLIVQPRATRFLGRDDDALEAFLTALGAGNRTSVLVLIAGIVTSGIVLPAVREPEASNVALYLIEAVALVAATAAFAKVTWRLWPQRVFALPHERPIYRASFRRHAFAMVILIGTAFAAAVANLAVP